MAGLGIGSIAHLFSPQGAIGGTLAPKARQIAIDAQNSAQQTSQTFAQLKSLKVSSDPKLQAAFQSLVEKAEAQVKDTNAAKPPPFAGIDAFFNNLLGTSDIMAPYYGSPEDKMYRQQFSQIFKGNSPLSILGPLLQGVHDTADQIVKTVGLAPIVQPFDAAIVHPLLWNPLSILTDYPVAMQGTGQPTAAPSFI